MFVDDFGSFLGGLIFGCVGGFIAAKKLADGNTANNQQTMDILNRENDKLKTRITEMEIQIQNLTKSNEKRRNSQKESDEEIEDLEDELKSAKNKVKNLQTQNNELSAQVEESRLAVESLKIQLAEAKGE